MTDLQRAREQLLFYIAPNTPVTQEENTAFDNACAEQAAYLAQAETVDGVTHLSIGDYSVEGDGRVHIAEMAKAILRNAHLKTFSLPVAKRM